MDCRQTQERILDSLAEFQTPANRRDVEDHLAGCEACRNFSQAQMALDHQLSAAISAPSLSPLFRSSLAARLRRERPSVWPEFLPDVAHLAGCLCATALCLMVLPFAPRPVLLAGLSFTLVSYFAQTLLQGSLEAWEDK